ncbi:MAG TPA: GNAT family N-acetyltransferase [Candidatus Eremiobacteraceae bacterium]|jgi:GNAT superfamily N-acetyltransferase
MNDASAKTAIRRATPSDGEAVRRFVFDTLRAYGVEPEPHDHDKDVMTFGQDPEPIDAFVADVDGVAVGSVMVAPRASGVGWLSKFFVDGAYRGRGIGRALLERAVAAARDRGYKRLALDTRTYFKEAIHLYEATGWRLSPGESHPPCDAYYYLDI